MHVTCRVKTSTKGTTIRPGISGSTRCDDKRLMVVSRTFENERTEPYSSKVNTRECPSRSAEKDPVPRRSGPHSKSFSRRVLRGPCGFFVCQRCKQSNPYLGNSFPVYGARVPNVCACARADHTRYSHRQDCFKPHMTHELSTAVIEE